MIKNSLPTLFLVFITITGSTGVPVDTDGQNQSPAERATIIETSYFEIHAEVCPKQLRENLCNMNKLKSGKQRGEGLGLGKPVLCLPFSYIIYLILRATQ